MEKGWSSGGEDFFRLVSRFIRLTPPFSFSLSRSLSFLSDGRPTATAEDEEASAPMTTLGGGLISEVGRDECAGAGAGAVASRATTAAGTNAELEVLPDSCAL